MRVTQEDLTSYKSQLEGALNNQPNRYFQSKIENVLSKILNDKSVPNYEELETIFKEVKNVEEPFDFRTGSLISEHNYSLLADYYDRVIDLL